MIGHSHPVKTLYGMQRPYSLKIRPQFCVYAHGCIARTPHRGILKATGGTQTRAASADKLPRRVHVCLGVVCVVGMTFLRVLGGLMVSGGRRIALILTCLFPEVGLFPCLSWLKIGNGWGAAQCPRHEPP